MKATPDSAARNPITPGQGQMPGQGSGQSYSPSVPISVYRELSAELQATKAMLDSLNLQNQQLTGQNQQLRQEVDRLVQSALTLQQLLGSAQSQPRRPVPSPPPAAPEMVADMVRSQASRAKQQPSRPPMASTATFQDPKPQPLDSAPLSDDLFTEQGEDAFLPETKPAPKNMGGLWLTLTIMVIVITAFGAGFLVVRPLLPGR